MASKGLAVSHKSTANSSKSVAKKRRKHSPRASGNGRTRLTAVAPEPRETLLRVAKQLFARNGLKETSIRDIAKEANLNSSLISYYFEGKEGLYRECLREIGESQLYVVEQLLQESHSSAEFRLRLKMMAEHLVRVFFDDRETGLIVMREYDRIHSPAELVFRSSFLKVFDRLIEFFAQAEKAGAISKDKDPFVLASLFFGALFGEMRMDHIKHKIYKRSILSPEERSVMIAHLLEMFFN